MTCTASVGHLINGSLAGPGLPSSNLTLQAVGTIGYAGENMYSVSSGPLSENIGSVYTCTAANSVSSIVTSLGISNFT